MKQQIPDKVKPFTFHGVELFEIREKETIANCPFCQKDGHFCISNETGQWSCKRCGEGQGKGEGGNIPGFIQKLYQLSLDNFITNVKDTESHPLKELSENRKIGEDTLSEWGVTAHPFNSNDYLIPVLNKEAKLANLFRVTPSQEHPGKLLVLPTPTLKIHPVGTQLLKKQRNIWLAEGPWDGMVLYNAFKKYSEEYKITKKPENALIRKNGVLVLPGCNSFSKEWFEPLKDKNVYILFDNDHPKKLKNGKTIQPGYDGTKRILRMAEKETTNNPKSIHYLEWGPDGYTDELDSGFDLRDLFSRVKGSEALQLISSKLKFHEHENVEEDNEDDEDEAKPVTTVEILPCTTFRNLCSTYEKGYHFTPEMRQSLVVMLATIISTDIPGTQIFLRVIGPPGSGKTTLAETVSAAKEYVLARSIVTGFHSGYVDPADMNKKKKKVSSLIPEMLNKTIVMKDADTLLTAPKRDQILSELRDIFDGVSRAEYRNQVKSNYEDIRTTFILCGTDALRKLNRAYLGDRFLDTEIFEESSGDPFVEKSMSNQYALMSASFSKEASKETEEQKEILKRITSLTVGYIHYLKGNLASLPFPPLDEESSNKLKGLANLLAYLRARSGDQKEDTEFRARPELATRLSSQFVKLTVCICLVLNKPSIDNEVMDIIRKVMLDTARGFHLEIVKLLIENRKGLSVDTIKDLLRTNEIGVRRILEEMRVFGIVKKISESNTSGNRGRNVHLWYLSKNIRNIWNSAMQP